MIITYYCLSCFKIESRDTVIVFDPPSKKSGLRPPRFQTDIALSSHNHDRHNGAEEMPGRQDGFPFIINRPGEYEIKNIQIKGVPSFHDSGSGKKHGLNTIYIVKAEEITLCHLGDFGENELSPEMKEIIGTPDILFLPIGGDTVLETSRAVSITRSIEPHIIIPMHYANSEKDIKENELKKFLKEMAEEKIEPLERLTIKKKEIPQEETRIVALKPTYVAS